MSAGLPGLGLGGLFFLISALLAPFVEVIRTVRGRSSAQAWRAVGRQFALALTIIAVVGVTLVLLRALVGAAGLGDSGDRPLTALSLLPVAGTLALLACVLATAKAMQIYARLQSRPAPALPTPLSLPSRHPVLAGLTAVAVIQFAVLIGASELSPLSGGASSSAEPGPSPAIAALRPSVAGAAEPRHGHGPDLAGASGRSRAVDASHPRQTEPRSSQDFEGGPGEGPQAPASSNGNERHASAVEASEPVETDGAAPAPAQGGQVEAPPTRPTPPAHAGPPAETGPATPSRSEGGSQRESRLPAQMASER